MKKPLVWNVRLFGTNEQLFRWVANTEPTLVYREDGKVLAQWKNDYGLVTVLVSAHHSISIATVEPEDQGSVKK